MIRPATAASSIRSVPRVVLLAPRAPPPQPLRCCDSSRFLSSRARREVQGHAPSASISGRRLVSTAAGLRPDPNRPAAAAQSAARLAPEFFSSHRLASRGKHAHASTTSSASTPTTISFSARGDPGADLPAHRRRAARRNATANTSTPATASPDAASHPPDASSVLSTHAASQPAHSFRRALSAYLSLSKPRLTVLVVLSAMAPYALYPVPAFLAPTVVDAPSLSPLTLLFLTTGTALCSASANALNMLYEPSTDAKMTRTRNRPLVRGLVTRTGAIVFAVACAALGISSLYFGVNPTVSGLGAANIALYAGLYTPLKAVTAANTWVGALVGGIPPLMGWAAAAGESATSASPMELLFAPDGSSLGGWLLASLLFAWQFPHFMALSWSIAPEYKAAGLRMLAWTNPARNARVALRYSLVFYPICLGLCLTDVTSWSFALTSLPVNVWVVREAVRFWRYEGHKGSARGLFWASVWHLPVVLGFAVLQKKGMWERVWRSIVGEEEEDWEDDDELVEFAPVESVGGAKTE
ncbi:related to protoheme IX farnesyltransferase, mitochondrial precursor [Cephalotrichum gorgonifer]|uniref:Protoheme IX farnesyltransferase, mitochondrial n=1 Tax=Cephalotrichum gorgonifer TaxID=2041049 RepID=A0AAE8SYR1_9PEZI|nr:related to protoheme IX farnesyltransferase, mitochondrial precursor [Cephalotrichum gorgonifer]